MVIVKCCLFGGKNIRAGAKHKTLCRVLFNLTKNHMKTKEILQVTCENYTLGATYCRRNMAKGGEVVLSKTI